MTAAQLQAFIEKAHLKSLGDLLGEPENNASERIWMKYYVYFDAYGHARHIVTEQELAEKFHNDPNEFLTAMGPGQPDAPTGHTTGHVGTLNFDTEMDLKEYLAGLGDEITGFYGCRSESRPYNF